MYLTHKQYLARIANMNSKYWNEGKSYRWIYMQYVIQQLQIMGAVKTIEAGCSGIPLNSNSYLFDLPLHDLNVFPYYFYNEGAIPDKYYDCFIALQVWEHLDRQAEAFKEVMRISKNAILSFPYKWNFGDKRHRGITGEKIDKWTCGVKPVSIKIINHRAIYVWEFEK